MGFDDGLRPAKLAGLLVFDVAAELGLEPRQYESESYNIYLRIKPSITKIARC